MLDDQLLWQGTDDLEGESSEALNKLLLEKSQRASLMTGLGSHATDAERDKAVVDSQGNLIKSQWEMFFEEGDPITRKEGQSKADYIEEVLGFVRERTDPVTLIRGLDKKKYEPQPGDSKLKQSFEVTANAYDWVPDTSSHMEGVKEEIFTYSKLDPSHEDYITPEKADAIWRQYEDEQNNIVINAADDLLETTRGLFVDLPLEAVFSVSGALEAGYRAFAVAETEEEKQLAKDAMYAKLSTIPELLAAGQLSGARKVGRGFSGFREAPIEFIMALAGAGGIKNLGRMSKLKSQTAARNIAQKKKSVESRIIPTGSKKDAIQQAAEIIAGDLSNIKATDVALAGMREVGDARRAFAEGSNLGLVDQTEKFLRHLDEGGVPVASKSKTARLLSENILRLFFDPSYKVDVATATKLRELDEGATALAFEYLNQIPNLDEKHPGATKKLHAALTHGSDEKSMNAKYEAINLIGDLARLEGALSDANAKNAATQVKAIESKIKTVDKRLAAELKKVDAELSTLQSLQRQETQAREASFAESEMSLQSIPDSPDFQMPAKTQSVRGGGDGVTLKQKIIPQDPFEALRVIEETNAPLIGRMRQLEDAKAEIISNWDQGAVAVAGEGRTPQGQALVDINKEISKLKRENSAMFNKRSKLMAETKALVDDAESIPISRKDADRQFSYEQQQQRRPLEEAKGKLRQEAAAKRKLIEDAPEKTVARLEPGRTERRALVEQLKDPLKTSEEVAGLVDALQTSLKKDLKRENLLDKRSEKLLKVKPKKVATLADFLVKNLDNPHLDFTIDGKPVNNIQFYFKLADEGTGSIDPRSLKVTAKDGAPEGYASIAESVQDTRRALMALSQEMPKVNTAPRGKKPAPLITDDVVAANIIDYIHNPTRKAKFGVDRIAREIERLEANKREAAKPEREKELMFEQLGGTTQAALKDKAFLTSEGIGPELGFTKRKEASRRDTPDAVLEDLRLRSVEELSAMLHIGVTKAIDAAKHYTTMSDIVKMNEANFGNKEPHRVLYENEADFNLATGKEEVMSQSDYVKVPTIKTNDKGGTVFGELSGMLLERRAFDMLRQEMRIDDVFSIPSAETGSFRRPVAITGGWGGLASTAAKFYRDTNQIMKGTMTISNPVYFANTFKGYTDLLVMEGVAPWIMWKYMSGVKKDKALTDAMLETGYFKDSAMAYGTLDSSGQPWNLNLKGIPKTFLKSITDTALNTGTDARTLWRLTERLQKAMGEGDRSKIGNQKWVRRAAEVARQAPQTGLKDAPTFGGFNAQVAAWMDFNAKRAMMDTFTKREAAAQRKSVDEIYKDKETMTRLAKLVEKNMVGYKRMGGFNREANRYNPAQPFTNWNVRSRSRGLNYITKNPLKGLMAKQATLENQRDLMKEKNLFLRQLLASIPTKKASMSMAAPDIKTIFTNTPKQIRDLWIDLTYMSVISADTFSLAPMLSANLLAAPVSERAEILRELRSRYSEELLRWYPKRDENGRIETDDDGMAVMLPVEDPLDVEWSEVLKNNAHMVKDEVLNTLWQTDTGLVRIARAFMGDRAAYDPKKKATASPFERLYTDVPASMLPNIYSFYFMGELAGLSDKDKQSEMLEKYGELRSPALNLNPGELYAKMLGVPIFRPPEEKNDRYNSKIKGLITQFNNEFTTDIEDTSNEDMSAFLIWQREKFQGLLEQLKEDRKFHPRSGVISPGPAQITVQE